MEPTQAHLLQLGQQTARESGATLNLLGRMEAPQYSRRIKDWPEDERPRERLQQQGENSLSDAQLLAIVLRTGDHASGATAIDLARRLLTEFHEDLEAMSNAAIN